MEKIFHSPGLMIGIGVVLVIVICVICYYLARFMKGSIKLELKGKSFHSGDQITGVLNVKVKKNLYADRVYVALIGEREERRRRSSSSGTTTSTQWVEFYRDEVDVLLDTELQPGFDNTYNIAIGTPSEGQVMNTGQAISKVAENMEDGVGKSIATGIGALATSAGSMLSGRKRWKVYARLETKGVDLATSKRIHVSLKSM